MSDETDIHRSLRASENHMSRLEKNLFSRFYFPQFRSIRAKVVFLYILFIGLLLGVFFKAASTYKKVDYYSKMSVVSTHSLLATTYLRGLARSLMLDHYRVVFNSKGTDERLKSLAPRRLAIQKQFLRIDELVQEEVVLRNNIFNKKYNYEPSLTFSDASEFKKLFSDMYVDLDMAIEAVSHQDMKRAKFLLLDAEEEKLQKKLVTKLTSVIEHQGRIADSTILELEKSIDDIKTLIVVSLFLGFSISAFLLFGMFRSIGKRFRQLEFATSEVANGNFDFNLRERGDDELSKLVQAFNVMAVKLKILQKDLSQQHQFLAHSAKLSSMGEMAGGIAHEINTPLAVIKMLASQLKVAIESGFADVDKISSTSEKIDKTVDRISEIVKTLQSLSKSSNTEIFKTHSVKSVIEDAVSLCREKFKAHGVDLIYDHASIEDIAVDCQRAPIAQVILSLLDNAYYAAQMSEKKWVKVSLEHTHDRINLLIADSGHAISEEIKKKLFQPFFTTKEFGSGTGLGLSISKAIIGSHFGNLVLNENCEYTQFEMTLPRVHKQ